MRKAAYQMSAAAIATDLCSVAVEAAVLQVHHFDISGLGASCTDKPEVNCGLWQLRLQLAG